MKKLPIRNFSILTLILLLASNHLLEISGPMWWISLVTGLLITWSVVGTALGFGARYADFKAENRAAALGGVGGVAFLFTALGLTLVVISLGTLPAYRLVRHWLSGMALSTADQWLMGAALAAMVLAAVAVPWVCMKIGLKKLQN